jgi:hypothetical protein
MDFLDHEKRGRQSGAKRSSCVKQNKDKGIFELKHCSTKKTVETVQPKRVLNCQFHPHALLISLTTGSFIPERDLAHDFREGFAAIVNDLWPVHVVEFALCLVNGDRLEMNGCSADSGSGCIYKCFLGCRC